MIFIKLLSIIDTIVAMLHVQIIHLFDYWIMVEILTE
jgi:hypothetical protein